ncbi:phage tail protein [Anaerosalibacter bizertensis]|uniref:phage tail spike protein n=1 Tax=Anaerosalibacter bizertensis TaxID=932217 RepID=UPI001C0F1E5E|nr:phage tail spike protein [Anaerosalibacter bizertensis]MBU5293130.1 phage tail protein [Anaerosalibacter bizertensis]
MLKLYNVNKEKIEGLTKYKDLVRERDLKKGEDTLSFSYPKSLSRNIKEECYIETKFNLYVIKEIDNSNKDWINVVAKVNTEDLKSRTFPHFEMVNSYLKDTLNLTLAGTGWTIGYNDIVKRRTVRVSNKTPLEVIDEIRKVYRAEIFFDAINKKVNVYEKLGEDKGDFFMEDVNLKSLNISSDSYDYVTRLIPLGKDGLTIEEINGGKKYVENYQYSDKIIYATWEDNRYTVVENLKEDAIAKLEELSKPYKSYEADVIDLRGANLGDIITLISKENEVKEKQRVVKITEYIDEPWNNKVEIANKTYTFEEMQSEVMDTVETADTVLTSDGMVDESKIDFNPIRQEFVTIIAEKADIVDLNAANARIGDLEATKANITDLEAVNARIDNLKVEDLTAINADITFLKNDVAEINHLLAGNITAENIAVGAITAGSGIIADGAIGDAQISSLSASKLSAGIIDAAIITVKNLNADNITVGTINGQRIAEGAIDNSKVAEGANIAGSKLDINDVIININGAETQIDGTKIQVGDRTLDVELSTQKLAIDENSQEISNQRAQIQALDNAIKLKVDNQTFNQYKATNDNNITTINTQLSKNTASIDILQEEINLKVSQTDVEKLINDIEIGGRNLILNSNTPIEFPNMEIIPTDGTVGGIEIYGDEWGRNLIRYKMIRPISYLDSFQIDNNKIIVTSDKGGYGITRDYTIPVDPNTDYIMNGEFNIIKGEVTAGFRVGFRETEEGAITWQPPFKDTPRIINTGDYNFMVFAFYTGIPVQSDEGVQVEIYNWKLEKGSTATPWSPAPEDFNNIKGVLYNLSTDIENNIWYTLSVKTDIVNDFIGVWLGNNFVGFLDDNNTITFSTGADNQDRTIILKSLKEEGTIEWAKLEKGTKATDWTPAPEDIESEITAINTKVAGIDITLDSITERVSSTESKIIKVNDEVSAIESRVSSAEQKITDSAIVTTVRNSTAYKNDLDNKANQEDLNLATNKITTLEQTSENFKISINKYENGKLKGAYYDFTGEAAIFKGAGFVILNDNYTSVLQGDTEGNLHIVGDFVAYQNGERAVHLTKNSIRFHNWYKPLDNPVVGTIYGAKRLVSESEPGLAITHYQNSRFSILHSSSTNSNPYIDFDVNNVLGVNSEYPIQTYEPTIFFQKIRCDSSLYFGDNVRIRPFGNKLTYKAENHEFLSLYDSVLFTYNGMRGAFEYNRKVNITGDLSVSGKKNSLQKTENHGERLINAYETAEYFFGDIGSGKIDEGGLCYIYIDDIFQECVNTEIEYHVFLQKCGQGDVWIKEKHETYFIVEGTSGLNFSWELKAKRKGYEQHRLEQPDNLDFERDDSVSFNRDFEQEDKKDKELEKIYDDKLNFDLVNLLLKEVV